MPPIEVLDWEPDDDGGWWVQWIDRDNLDGNTVEGVYHLEPDNVDGLMEIRRAQGHRIADESGTKLMNVRGKVADGQKKTKTPGQMPDEVADWAGVYDEVVGESKERYELGVHGAAPRYALMQARKGEKIPKIDRRSRQGDKGPFA